MPGLPLEHLTVLDLTLHRAGPTCARQFADWGAKVIKIEIPGGPKGEPAPYFDVVGFGLNSIDLVSVVAEFPQVNTKQRLQRFARLPGGQMGTAMATCARLISTGETCRSSSICLSRRLAAAMCRLYSFSSSGLIRLRPSFSVSLSISRSSERTSL